MTPETTYRFVHKRKGTFVARFRGVHPNPGDPTDPEFWWVTIPTGPGSGQEKYANALVRKNGKKVPPETTDKLLRPSLITEVVESVVESG